jgi:hypothetical protein
MGFETTGATSPEAVGAIEKDASLNIELLARSAKGGREAEEEGTGGGGMDWSLWKKKGEGDSVTVESVVRRRVAAGRFARRADCISSAALAASLASE